MTESLYRFIEENRAAVEAALRKHLPLSSLSVESNLNRALTYSLFPGGKRLRPMLSLLASSLVGLSRDESLMLACAIEFVHSSSLIIDDLPAMDDADRRRNRPALHLAFGQGTAILAALALLNQAYALFAEVETSVIRGTGRRLVVEASRAVGTEGMIGGQALDLELSSGHVDEQSMAKRDLKTVALMRLTMTAGAIVADSHDDDFRALAEFGSCIGRAYQVCDDLLDQLSGESSGKDRGQDARHGRANAASTIGVKAARVMANQLIASGSVALKSRFSYRFEARLLTEAAECIVDKLPSDITVEELAFSSLARGQALSAGD